MPDARSPRSKTRAILTQLRQAWSHSLPLESQANRARMLIWITLPPLVAFAAFNHLSGRDDLFLVEGGVAIGLLTAALGLGRARLRRASMLAASFLVCALLFHAFLTGGIAGTGNLWLAAMPFVAMLVLGFRTGTLVTLAGLCCVVAAVTLHALGLISMPYTPAESFMTAVVFLVATALAFGASFVDTIGQVQTREILERLRASEEELRKAHAEMELKIAERTRKLARANRKLKQAMEQKEKALVDLREAQERFFQAQKMEAIGTLVGGIAHDFNNMLSGITANLYMVQLKTRDPEIRERLGKVDKLVMHAADMIRQLLTFARKDRVSLERFDLVPFTKEAFKLASVSIPETIRCELHLETDEAIIRGDATQLQQILMNLVNNARDALKGVQKPEIHVTLRRFVPDASFRLRHPDHKAKAFAVLSVRDNGCGIPEEQLSHIFEPFFTTKSTGKGTGLGLAMTYGAVQSHGGFIDVVSRPGAGTNFQIYLPLAEETKGSVLSVRDYEVHPGNGETLLLVDDDDYLREATRDVLEQLNYKVLEASDGREAVQVFQRHRNEIKLVLMDLIMPDMNGTVAFERIRRIAPEMRAIFITGYDKHSTFDEEKTGSWGSLLYKPLSVDSLSAAIRRELGMRKENPESTIP